MICGKILSISLTWTESSKWSLRVAEWALRQSWFMILQNFSAAWIPQQAGDLKGNYPFPGLSFSSLCRALCWVEVFSDLGTHLLRRFLLWRWGWGRSHISLASEGQLWWTGAGLAVHLNVTLSGELSGQEILLPLYSESTMDFLLCLLQGREWMPFPCASCVFELLVYVIRLHAVDLKHCFFDQSRVSNEDLVKFQDILINLERA